MENVSIWGLHHGSAFNVLKPTAYHKIHWPINYINVSCNLLEWLVKGQEVNQISAHSSQPHKSISKETRILKEFLKLCYGAHGGHLNVLKFGTLQVQTPKYSMEN